MILSDSHAPAALDSDMARTADELAGHCFGCGPLNSQGLHLSFVVREGDPVTAIGRTTLTRLHEGAPGYVHGGIIATLLDEVMSKLNRPLNALAMTRSMTVDYLRPVPLHRELVLVGRHIRREGRKLFHEAELQATDGTVLARSAGLFVVVQPELLAGAKQPSLR